MDIDTWETLDEINFVKNLRSDCKVTREKKLLMYLDNIDFRVWGEIDSTKIKEVVINEILSERI